MIDKLMFVQFIHPGGEHTPESGSVWNSGRHQRKFLLSDGSYLTKLETDPKQGKILFWGEWEPPAEVTATIAQPLHKGPLTIFSPWYYTPPGGTNTDPFVFGEHFLYSCCQQTSETALSQMSFLLPGSVILFGSHVGGGFALDTVFVVKHGVDYTPSNATKYFQGKVSDVFRDTVLKTFEIQTKKQGYSLSANNKNASFVQRLYFGATHNDRDQFAGMFSYTPCIPFTPESNGFARPIIIPTGNLQQKITPKLLQGYRLNDLLNDFSTTECMSALWQEVTEQVLNAELMLGVDIQLPSLRPNNNKQDIPTVRVGGGCYR